MNTVDHKTFYDLDKNSHIQIVMCRFEDTLLNAADYHAFCDLNRNLHTKKVVLKFEIHLLVWLIVRPFLAQKGTYVLRKWFEKCIVA